MSAIVLAASRARTPLAIAEAGAVDLPITFVNASFAELLESDASTWVGRPLSALSAPVALQFAPGTTERFDVMLDGGRRLPVGLSIVAVPGPGGDPSCLLCSLVDARGDGAAEAIARDADMLAQVAIAAGELMSEAAAAARASASDDGAELALDAIRRTVPPIDESAS